MGNMVEVMVLTDHWDDIKKNPKKLTEAIDEGMDGIPMYREGKYLGRDASGYSDAGNGIQVLPWHHADEFRITVSHRNSFSQFSGFNLMLLDEQGWFDGAEFRVGIMEEYAAAVAAELRRFRDELQKIRAKHPKPKWKRK